MPPEARALFPYGIPMQRDEAAGTDNILVKRGYVLAYDRRMRNARWVVEHLTAASLKGNGSVTRANSVFKEDPAVPAVFRAKLLDYQNSGYDRGHLAPAGDNKLSQEAMDDTFYLTNMSPQVGAGFNRNYWSRLEQFMRTLTASYTDVYVLTGPLWLPKRDRDGKHYVRYEVIGDPPNVSVPTHFFKVVLVENPGGANRAVAAFVLENAPIEDERPLESFQVPLEMVERNAGLLLFPRLDRSRAPSLCLQTSCQLPSPDFYKKPGKPKAA